MEFTYNSYRLLLNNIKDHGYAIASYATWPEHGRSVILRHDIDNSIEKALKLARIENESEVSSTYFVLLTSDFYNVFSAKSASMLKEILRLGHEVGLHFDEVRYPEAKLDELAIAIKKEADILSAAIGVEVKSVSMHRPGKAILEADLKIPGLINSYGKTYFKEFKYLSDSRRRWREPVNEIIDSGQYNRLHILTHAFWYNETNTTIGDTVKEYVNRANYERYISMSENITDIASIMEEGEVVRA